MKKPADPKSDKMDKTERYEAVARAVLSIVHLHGVDSVTHSRISRIAKVSRAWLYKYVGSSREKIMSFAADHMGALFTDLGPAQPELSREQWFKEIGARFLKILEMTERFPNVPRVYFQHRATHGLLGRRLEKVAQRLRDREVTELTAIFGMSSSQAERVSEILSAVRMGLAHSFAPTPLPEEAVKRTLRNTAPQQMVQLLERLARASVDEVLSRP